MRESDAPKLARVTMSASYYSEMQRSLTAAVKACNEAYSLIRRHERGSYTDLEQLIEELDGMLRDIRNKIEAYTSPL